MVVSNSRYSCIIINFYRKYHGNKLECAPWSTYLDRSDIQLNPSSHIPFELTKKITNENDLNNEKVINWIQCKISTRVIVLGAPASGKTTFIKLVSDQSKFPIENVATDGISITNVNNITFWDFGGQEVLFSTHKFFLADRCQYIIVVDLSKLVHEDESIRNDCLKYIDFWMKEIHTFTTNFQHSPPVLFLGTHCDLIYNYFSWTSKINEGKQALLRLAESNHLNCVPEVFQFYKSSNQSTLHSNISKILIQIQNNSEKFNEIEQRLSNMDNIVHSLQFCILRHNIEIKRKEKPYMMQNEFENLFFGLNVSQETINKYTKLLKISGIIETYRFESSAASKIIFLDPKWLSELFTSIISIKNYSSKNKRGFFTKNQIEDNFKSQEIPIHIWEDIIKIFEMFHLVVLLPSEEYYVPAMLHSPKSSKPSHLGTEKNKLIINAFKEKNIKYKCMRKKFEFSPRIPFGFIDKLIVKYLHFPGIIMHESTWKNDFYLILKEDGNSNNRFYHILIRAINKDENNEFMNTELIISVFYPDIEEDTLYFSFFCHFIFQSPYEIATSSIHSTSSIENIFILGGNHPIGDEKEILFNFRNNLHFQKYFFSSDIKIFDSEIHKCEIIKKLGSGAFGQVFLGKMIFDLSRNIENDVVFKETKFISFDSLRNLINECMMMKIIENQFTIKLLGICMPSMRFLDSRKKIHMSDENYVSTPYNSSDLLEISSGNFNDEEYFNHQIVMIIEEAPWGNLAQCHEIIQEKNSTKLKLKIAIDVARGLNSLYFKSGVKLIHRDVKSENIFIFSLDEKSISTTGSVHAKVGDFGSIVAASPSYSQRIGNYQYTAPEALRGCFSVPYSKEIDVYSFGILFWEILTGKIPFLELKENPETCNKIEEMIIDGYRPSLDILPDDTPLCIIEVIKECWSLTPSKRPTFGKIISILQLELAIEQEKNEQDSSIESSVAMKQLIGKNIDLSFFSNIQFIGRGGSHGLVMICEFLLNGNIYNVTLKMLIDLSNEEIPSSEHRKTINEYNILPLIQHPNIVCLLGSFQCIPSNEMIDCFDESMRYLFFDNTGFAKKYQFYILENYNKTLKSVIRELNEEKMLKYSLQLSSALLFLFNHNITHLDISLDNLMLSSNDDIIVIDFGVAGKMDSKGLVQYSQTQGGNSIHLAPEVFAAKSNKRNLPCKGQHSWELGTIMFQMFNKGDLPFKNYGSSFSFSKNSINIFTIPEKFLGLISSLLCPLNERISISEAHETLLRINSNTNKKKRIFRGWKIRAGWRRGKQD